MADFETLIDPPYEELEPLRQGLDVHNRRRIGDYSYAKLAVIARDAAGALAGGAEGDLYWGWLHIQTLWVAPGARGQGLGSALLRRLETAAAERGVAQYHLETTSFQARAFYERHGYSVFGTLEGKPPGHTWYYMQKRPAGGPEPSGQGASA
jgi:ribosomal protein S18 acetylase RimI-like enzyme